MKNDRIHIRFYGFFSLRLLINRKASSVSERGLTLKSVFRMAF